MPRFSIGRRLTQRWMLVVTVVVVAVAGLAVYRLHGIFASHDVTSTPSGAGNDIVPFNPKHVVMEVFGPPGTVATITYLDVNAQPQRADAVSLPWAYDTTTTAATSSIQRWLSRRGIEIRCIPDPFMSGGRRGRLGNFV